MNTNVDLLPQIGTLAGEAFPGHVFNRKTAALANLIRRSLRSLPSRVLVVGCGDGRDAAQLAVSLDADATGVDGDRNFDTHAARYATLRTGDVSSLEFGDSTFDFVYSYQHLDHISRVRRSLNEMRRVLRRGGSYCVGVRADRGFTSTELRSELIAVFGEAADVTQAYRDELREQDKRLIGVLSLSWLPSFLTRSVYFIGRHRAG